MTSVRQILEGKRTPSVISVSPDTSVYEALELMAAKDVSAVLVLEADRMVGIFTERDYARKLVLKGRASKATHVGELMTQNLLTISPSQTVDDVMEIMTGNRIRHLPVVERGQLIGIVTIGDAVKAVIDAQQQTIRQLEGYIAGDLSAG
ncbi:MAG: histidine kinase [Candidatus Dactylopiibacterium carminicum]|uniref:CBS domain-containing protein n=1 Tax=Candidatus Dactylopiibacterium carminicum TaxID=857335 RepID=A0A272EVE4_9RHOO|nr:CBS domain-containing protein [Candidatus Dactylopiibacterium carminicum]KAF7600145.1 CBS domain-containing protein [Candidatus Dactylopiibacterium carminicum]PAS94026.1 MAG: histidine kinase [Candidatus Dactylopiibacterium carminicum]PAS98211.1 MAG: histidine kinase [Candidatus Dactylopiibacterium carminicum]PAT00144.1 MAG: histidine kinase [Candidatus Dactylopiibacterium carminicum]